MALEPIGSMMSIQAQTVTNVKPVERVEKPVSEYKDVTAQEAAQMADPSVSIVEASSEKGDASENADGGENRQAASQEQIRKAVESMNKKMANAEAVFGIHEGTNRVTIKIVDKETKKTIKELPPEKTLDMIAKVWEMAGILVDEKR